MELVTQVYRVVRKLPAEERYALASQMRRAAVSIRANIAEGHGRSHLGDKLRLFSIANGSVKELETEVMIARRLGYISQVEHDSLLGATTELSRMMSSLVKRLRPRVIATTYHPPTTN